jgi:hypothetical protein
MANDEQLAIIKSGVASWNEYRANKHHRELDLRNAKLSGRDLQNANFLYVDLRGADFSNCILTDADFESAKLDNASFRDANLQHATFENAELDGADFSNAGAVDTTFGFANIAKVEFSHASLAGASFEHMTLQNVNMHAVDFEYATMRGVWLVNVDFSQAQFGGTVFADTNFIRVRGIESAHHKSASSIGTDTFFNSRGLPEVFLRGAGLPDEFIDYASALLGKPIEYYSCFISYASADSAIAHRLHSDLQAAGIRTWFAPKDLRIGDKFRTRIDESIRLHEKLIVILSASSVESAWVEKEVETAFARERSEHRDVLFPMRIDEAVFQSHCAWAADIVNTRHIGDFVGWKDHDNYARAFDRLVRDLKKEGPTVMGTPSAPHGIP